MGRLSTELKLAGLALATLMLFIVGRGADRPASLDQSRPGGPALADGMAPAESDASATDALSAVRKPAVPAAGAGSEASCESDAAAASCETH